MAVELILIVLLLVSSTQAGYLYPKPALPFELPINKLITKINHQTAAEDSSQSKQIAVSYSVPFEDFDYLKQHNAEYHSSPYNSQLISDNVGSEKLLPQSYSQTNTDLTANQYVQIIKQAADNDESTVVQAIIQRTVSNNNNDIQSLDEAPNDGQFVDSNINHVVVQNTVAHTGQPAFVQKEILSNTIQPQVKKHIYFHVPPPDIEEPSVYNVPEPPKKIYKIIFIKVPSHEPSKTAQIQDIYNQINQAPPVEDKTLIYVLVKKPEPIQVLHPPAPTPSEHEVLFVKYRENSVSDLLQGNSVSSPAPIIQ